jgi:hypothetical protein
VKQLHRPTVIRALALWALAAACVLPAQAQRNAPRSSTTTMIYSCTAPDGRRITSDRLISECVGLEQRVLNRDGTVRMVVTPPLSSEDAARKEMQERRAAAERMARQEDSRRDRNLMARYVDESAHQRARAAALETVRQAIAASEARLAELAADRKKLDTEAEFYRNKALPPKLREAFDANEASAEAQRALSATQKAELDRVNKLYDAELDRLKKLRAGAAPGSLGPLITSTAGAVANTVISPAVVSAAR